MRPSGAENAPGYLTRPTEAKSTREEFIKRWKIFLRRVKIDDVFQMFVETAFQKKGDNCARKETTAHANCRLFSSFTRLIRKALVEVCGLSMSAARKFTVHGLRVGGINFYRKRGVSVSLRA